MNHVYHPSNGAESFIPDPPTTIESALPNDEDAPPALPCPLSTDGPGEQVPPPPPPPPEMKSPAPAENEVPGGIKLQAHGSDDVGEDQSQTAPKASYDMPMSMRGKPDFVLPKDANGLPYGPIGIHRNADAAEAEAWEDAFEWWKNREALPHERRAVESADEYRLATWTKINKVRLNEDPLMPTLSKIAHDEIPYTLQEIDDLRPRLNEHELEFIGTLIAVAEADPNYPAKVDCYCPKTGRYWHRMRLGWNQFNKEQYETQLIAEGFDGGRNKTAKRGSEVSEIIRKVTLRQIALAGAWSGHAEGLHVSRSGKAYLSTKDSPMPRLEPGDFAHLWSYICKLLGEGIDSHFPTQLGLLLAWLRHAITALQQRDKTRPSRLLVLTGEQSNGKSTLLNKIISPAFGGRTASGLLMMSGKTAFNSELAEAELITFDDIPNNLQPHETANTLKNLLVGNENGMLVHAKNQDAVTIPVLHRLVWCCNNDPNALRHLPKMRANDGMIDKVITLRTYNTHISVMSADDAKAFRDQMTEQVPALLAWLMSAQADEHFAGVMIDGRGPKAWLHPEIEAELLDMCPEQHLLGMLQCGDEQNLWDSRGDTAHKIDMILSQLYRSRYDRLAVTSVKLGLMLGNLATKGTISKAPKSPNSKVANRWIVAGVSRKLGSDA